MSEVVRTGNTQRRKLRFGSLEEILREADALAAAEQTGGLHCSGDWTLGQIFGHLATWIEYAYNGTPLKPLWIVRLIMRIRGKQRFIEKPMPAGVRIPGVSGGTLGTETCSTEEGLRRLRVSVERLMREAPNQPNALFGLMTHDEWKKLHLRHAELHLGFARIDS